MGRLGVTALIDKKPTQMSTAPFHSNFMSFANVVKLFSSFGAGKSEHADTGLLVVRFLRGEVPLKMSLCPLLLPLLERVAKRKRKTDAGGLRGLRTKENEMLSDLFSTTLIAALRYQS